MSTPGPEDAVSCCCQGERHRRDVLAAALALLVAGGRPAWAQDKDFKDPKTQRPQPGDRLAYLSGDNKGQTVRGPDLKIGDPPRLAYPLDPASGVTRSSRANQILVAKVDPALLSDEMRAASQDGVVAYSAICTHNGCPVTVMRDDHRSVLCNCHGSVFDLADGGKVLDGPALRRLANLPVGVSAEGAVVVSGGFNGAVGPQKQ